MLVSILFTVLSVLFIVWYIRAYEEAKAAGVVFHGYIGEEDDEKTPDAVTSDVNQLGR